jgi:hypothetical protein
MPWGLIIRALPYVAVAVSLFYAGWITNGWRLESRLADLTTSYSQAYAQATEQAREREQSLQRSADTLRREKDARINTINSALNSALDSLRNRPERADSGAMPEASCPCDGLPPTRLARSDAEFLVRYAADAAKLYAAVQQCETQYNALIDRH